MKIASIRLSRLSAVFFSLSILLPLSALSGSFSTDFDSGQPGGTTVGGNAFVDSTGGVGGSGCLKLTTNGNALSGSFLIDDLDPGSRIGSFTATFKVRMGGGTTTPADGLSFNFGTDLGTTSPNGEEGWGSGINLTFDAFDNNNLAPYSGDNPEGPEFRLKNAGILLARRKVSRQFRTGNNFVDVQIYYTNSGSLTVVYGGSVIFSNLFVVGAQGTGTQFGFAARTGGLNENHFIDDLNITTTPVTRFYVKGAITPGQGSTLTASPDTAFQVALQDSGAAVDPASVTMTFGGFPVTPGVSKVGAVTTISYDPVGSLLYNSLNRVSVTFSDSSGPPANNILYDFTVASGPIWSLPPKSRAYLPADTDVGGGTTPLYRTIAYNAASNHLYVVGRTGPAAGLTINVLDPATGADLYQLNTNGIAGGSIVLIGIAVADDGRIYACNETITNGVTVYCWDNDLSSTVPRKVFSKTVSIIAASTTRWGDTLAARGSGTGTQLLMDATFNSGSPANFTALLTPTDSFLTNFNSLAYNHSYSGAVVGRGLQFGPTNTYLLKKTGPGLASSMPLQFIRYDTAPNVTILDSGTNFHQQVGPVTVDLSKNIAAGIFFLTNSADGADRLLVWDISNLDSPLQLAQYDFPTNHTPNANFIGQVIIGKDMIFAVDGNNGILAVPVIPPIMPHLDLALSGAKAILSWSNPVPAFALQATPVISPASWSTLTPITLINGKSYVTNSGGPKQFYRLIKP